MSSPGPDAVPRVAPKARLEWDEVRGRHVLLYPEGLVTLNASGAEVLRLCDGERSLSGILQALKLRYTSQGIDRDVTAFLAAMAAKGLVTWR